MHPDCAITSAHAVVGDSLTLASGRGLLHGCDQCAIVVVDGLGLHTLATACTTTGHKRGVDIVRSFIEPLVLTLAAVNLLDSIVPCIRISVMI